MNAYEQAVIGALMLNASAYWQVADIIAATDFTEARHVEIFNAIASLCQQGKPVDPVTMGDELPQHTTYLYELGGNSTGANARHYAEEVRGASENRRVKVAGRKIAVADCTYAEAQRILAEVAPRNTSSAKPIKAYMTEALALMMKRFDSHEVITGLATGLDDLDAITAGLQPGTLNILAARPSMGKTALALQIAVRTAVRKKRVMVFEMEMTGVQLFSSFPSVLCHSCRMCHSVPSRNPCWCRKRNGRASRLLTPSWKSPR